MNTFYLTLRKYLLDRHKSLLFKMAALVIVFIAFGFVLALTGCGGGDGEIILLMFSCMAASCVFASKSFESMQTAPGRIVTLMVPSSTFDKFMARWLVTVPFAAIFLALCCGIADVTRVILWSSFNPPTYQTSLLASGWNADTTREVITLSMSALVTQAFFFLGAILWPRLSFLKTLIVAWIGSGIAIILMLIVIKSQMSPIHYNLGNFPLGYYAGISLVVSLVAYWLAYIRFRESDIPDPLF